MYNPTSPYICSSSFCCTLEYLNVFFILSIDKTTKRQVFPKNIKINIITNVKLLDKKCIYFRPNSELLQG